MNKWKLLLDSLDLTTNEAKLKKQFIKRPGSRAFFPIAQILRKKHFIEEAIGLLNEGIKKHPHYVAARVALSELYFYRGLFQLAEDHLNQVTHKVIQNTTAQKIFFFLTLLQNDFEKALEIYERMRHYKLLDASTEAIGFLLTRKGSEAAKEKLFQDLKESGLEVSPELLLEQGQSQRSKHIDSSKPIYEKVSIEPIKEDQFFVMPIDEILFPIQDLSNGENNGLEQDCYLDSPTMAKIYESQEQYEQALSIYKRLLLKSPQNDSLRQKVAMLQDKAFQHKSENPIPAERLVQSMREVEKVDRQISQIQALISRIDSV